MHLRLRHLALTVLPLLAGCPSDDTSDDGAGSSDGTTSSMDTTAGPTSSPTTSDDASGSGSASGSTTDATTAATDSTGMSDETSSGAAACEGMTFFATSVGSGANGGDLGGLRGADATCQMLADAVGQGDCTWHAYLSTSTVDARDRIGSGPWVNSAGETIAADVDALHNDGLSNGDPQHVLDENGVEVPGNEHDILTGSNEDGTLLADTTCQDWTSSSNQDTARVGHSDIPNNPMFSPSWNSAHDTPGCHQGGLEQTGGSGRLYCFAID